MKYVITVEEKTFEIEIGHGDMVRVNRRPYTVDLQGLEGRPEYSLLINHRSYEAHLEGIEGDECQMVVAGRPYRARLQQQGRNRAKSAAPPDLSEERELCAPLPGLLVEMSVEEGQQVQPGEVVAVLESMKMNLELHSPWSGVVQMLCGTSGMEVGQGDVLAVIGPME
jgi:biotin carboxyl carrier protein